MHLKLIDRSNYFRGLLLLVRKDKEITAKEQEIIKKIAKILNYDQEFVDNALNGLLENEYISKEPPKFSNQDFAKAFIKDGLKMAFNDRPVHFNKIQWLKLIAGKNNLPEDWFTQELENIDTKCIEEAKKISLNSKNVNNFTKELLNNHSFELESYILKDSRYAC